MKKKEKFEFALMPIDAYQHKRILHYICSILTAFSTLISLLNLFIWSRLPVCKQPLRVSRKVLAALQLPESKLSLIQPNLSHHQ